MKKFSSNPHGEKLRNQNQREQMENNNNKKNSILIPNLEIIILNVNDLSKAIKRQRLAEWINICWPYETHFKYNSIRRLKVKDGKDMPYTR